MGDGNTNGARLAIVRKKELPVANLPRIVDVLHISEKPQFVVFQYQDFARFVARTHKSNKSNTLNIVSVLDIGGKSAFVVVGYEDLCQLLLDFDITGHIDESAYLDEYTDVAAAVAYGELRCASEHYIFQGYFERRRVRIPRSSAHITDSMP